MLVVRTFIKEKTQCLIFFYDIYFLIYLYQYMFAFLNCHYLSCNIFIVKTYILRLIVSFNLVEYMLRKYYPNYPCYLLCNSLVIVISCELISTEMYFLTKCLLSVCLVKLKLNKLFYYSDHRPGKNNISRHSALCAEGSILFLFESILCYYGCFNVIIKYRLMLPGQKYTF